MFSFRDIRKSYSGVEVLHGISFSIEPGRVIALIGENGAGKSTLAKILSGIITDYGGEILLQDQPLRFSSPREAERNGIAIIHQELNLIQDLSIAENLFLGREPVTRFGLINHRVMIREAQTLLDRFAFPYPPQTLVRNLSVGWQQMVEITRALGQDARVIIMDEPTSALSPNEIDLLFNHIEELKKIGKTFIFISHRLSEVFRLGDSVVILRDGHFMGSHSLAEIKEEELIQLMIGRVLSETVPDENRPVGETLLQVDGLNLMQGNKPILRDIHFKLAGGEVLGVAGLLGAGRTELLKTLFGVADGKTHAEFRFRGLPFKPESADDSIEKKIVFLAEDRKNEGILTGLNLHHNASVSVLDQITEHTWINPRREKQLVDSMFDKLEIKRHSGHQPINTLSGGNQQKVLLSRILLVKPLLLLLDEPTRGIDVGAKQEIYSWIIKAKGQGISTIMTSSDIPELLKICDRILVLNNGSQTALLESGRTDSQEILKYVFQQETA